MKQHAVSTFVYRCEDGYHFTVNIRENTAWLFLPGQTVNAARSPSASGVKYLKDDIVYWSKGNEALVSIGPESHRNCINDALAAVWEDAKLRGIHFRATGNEPGWHLEIGDKLITLVSDYGTLIREFPVKKPKTDRRNRATLYTTKNDDTLLEVRIEGKPCHDTMSGELFEATVSLMLNGKPYNGCGRALH